MWTLILVALGFYAGKKYGVAIERANKMKLLVMENNGDL